jgi:cell division protein FtsW
VPLFQSILASRSKPYIRSVSRLPQAAAGARTIRKATVSAYALTGSMNDSTLRQNQDNRHFFLSLALVLVGFGVLMVHSASITSWPTEFERVYLTKHLQFLAIAITAASVAGALPARFWFKAAPWLFLGTLLLLVAVLIPGVGTRVNGAQRWLRLAGFSMQPSELAKVTLPLFLARGILLCRERLGHWFFGTVPFVVPTALTAALVMLEPDLGTSAFLIGSAGLVLFFGGWPIRNFTVGVGAAVSAGVFLITVTTYRMRRITDFVSVWTDFRGSDAWQLKQSLIALGAGGLWGVGLGRGSQKLSFLPESNTDFVFAVVGEELGLAGTAGLAILWCGVFWSGARLFREYRPNCFAAIVAMTLLTQLVGQALLNTAVVTALVPTTGIPHPLVSYGGSSLVMSVVSLGIIVSMSRADETDDACVLI